MYIKSRRSPFRERERDRPFLFGGNMGWQRAAGRAEVYRALGCQRRECYSLSPRSRSSIPQLMRLPTQHMLASLRFHKIRCNASTERRRHPAPHRVRPRKVRGRALPFCPRAATRPHGAGEGGPQAEPGASARQEALCAVLIFLVVANRAVV